MTKKSFGRPLRFDNAGHKMLPEVKFHEPRNFFNIKQFGTPNINKYTSQKLVVLASNVWPNLFGLLLVAKCSTRISTS